MADLISSLPDEIICYILSFLRSQQVVATSVLSKRWNPLWRFVSSLDFDIYNEDFWSHIEENPGSTFYSAVCSFLVGRGDQPLHRIRLRCYTSMNITESIKTRIWNAMSESCRVQIIDLLCHSKDIVIPSMVFSFKTLVALKLEYMTIEDISFVDLPSLKILHLKHIFFMVKIDLSQLLSGCPNLEDLKVRRVACETEGKFNKLLKLVRVNIDQPLFPLEIFKDVEVLKFDLKCRPILYLNFDFHNLVELQLYVGLVWLLVVFKGLNHCPKLQSLVISFSFHKTSEVEDVSPYPQTVPACISSHLRTCRLKSYRGSKDEFQFARYILENAKYLHTMKIRNIHTLREEDEDMKRELSSCMKRSDTCTLSFE